MNPIVLRVVDWLVVALTAVGAGASAYSIARSRGRQSSRWAVLCALAPIFLLFLIRWETLRRFGAALAFVTLIVAVALTAMSHPRSRRFANLQASLVGLVYSASVVDGTNVHTPSGTLILPGSLAGTTATVGLALILAVLARCTPIQAIGLILAGAVIGCTGALAQVILIAGESLIGSQTSAVLPRTPVLMGMSVLFWVTVVMAYVAARRPRA